MLRKWGVVCTYNTCYQPKDRVDYLSRYLTLTRQAKTNENNTCGWQARNFDPHQFNDQLKLVFSFLSQMFFKKITAHADNHGRTLLNYKQDGNCFWKEHKRKIKMHFRKEKNSFINVYVASSFFSFFAKTITSRLNYICNLLCL